MTSVAVVDRLAWLVPIGDGAVFSRRSLGLLGLGDVEVRQLVRSGRLTRLHHGWYTLADPSRFPADLYRLRVLAFLQDDAARRSGGLVVGPAPVLTGAAALALLGLPLLGTPPAAITVAHAYPGGRAARGLVRPTGRLDPEDITGRAGVLLATPARAALDAARWCSVQTGVAAADEALRNGMLTEPELDDALDRMPRLWRVRNARLARTLVSALSESPGESWSAVVLNTLGLPPPDRQVDFRDRQGFIGRVDFWWAEQRVVGEFDGRLKYGRANPSGRPSEDVLWDEKLREDRIRGLDVRLVRWTVADLVAPAALAARLTAAGLARRP
jgi:hypothetical protein